MFLLESLLVTLLKLVDSIPYPHHPLGDVGVPQCIPIGFF